MDILRAELPVIRKIVELEVELESRRRGCNVGRDDPVVTENVAYVIQSNGGTLRHFIEKKLDASRS